MHKQTDLWFLGGIRQKRNAVDEETSVVDRRTEQTAPAPSSFCPPPFTKMLYTNIWNVATSH